MSWRVEFTSGALRQLKKLDPFVRRMLIAWVEKNLEGCADARAHGKSLVGDKSGLWRYRIGDYRLLCRLDDGRLVIEAIKVGHRRAAYK